MDIGLNRKQDQNQKDDHELLDWLMQMSQSFSTTNALERQVMLSLTSYLHTLESVLDPKGILVAFHREGQELVIDVFSDRQMEADDAEQARRIFSAIPHTDCKEEGFMTIPAIPAGSGEDDRDWGTVFDLKAPDGERVCVFIIMSDKSPALEPAHWKMIRGHYHLMSAMQTLQKDAQKKADQLERYFNNSLDLLCIVSEEGVFELVNPEWTSLLGYEKQDVIGRNITELIHPNDMERTINAIEKLRLGEPVEYF